MEREFTSRRLSIYEGKSLAERLELHQWDAQLSAAIMPALASFEIVFRNRVHRLVGEFLGQNDWMVSPQAYRSLGSKEQKSIGDAVASAQNHLARSSTQELRDDHVIAASSLSLWTKIVSTYYRNSIWDSRGRSHRLGALFPNAAADLPALGQIHEELKEIRLLRNRVAHHESIAKRPDLLAKNHERIHRYLQWMSPDVAMLVALADTLPDVLDRGPAQLPDDWKSIG
jgi:hypothetical protein